MDGNVDGGENYDGLGDVKEEKNYYKEKNEEKD